MQLLAQLAAAGVADPQLLQQVAAALLAAQAAPHVEAPVATMGLLHPKAAPRHAWGTGPLPGASGFPASPYGFRPFGPHPVADGHPFASAGLPAGVHPLAGGGSGAWPPALPGGSLHFPGMQHAPSGPLLPGHLGLQLDSRSTGRKGPYPTEGFHPSSTPKEAPIPRPAASTASGSSYLQTSSSPTRHSPTIHTVSVPTANIPEPSNPFQHAIHEPLPPVSSSESSLGDRPTANLQQSHSVSVMQGASSKPLPTLKSVTSHPLPTLKSVTSYPLPTLQSEVVSGPIRMKRVASLKGPTSLQTAPAEVQKPGLSRGQFPTKMGDPRPTAAEGFPTPGSPGATAARLTTARSHPSALGPELASVTPMTNLHRDVTYIVPPAPSFQEAAAHALTRSTSDVGAKSARGSQRLPSQLSDPGLVQAARGQLTEQADEAFRSLPATDKLRQGPLELFT